MATFTCCADRWERYDREKRVHFHFLSTGTRIEIVDFFKDQVEFKADLIEIQI